MGSLKYKKFQLVDGNDLFISLEIQPKHWYAPRYFAKIKGCKDIFIYDRDEHRNLMCKGKPSVYTDSRIDTDGWNCDIERFHRYMKHYTNLPFNKKMTEKTVKKIFKRIFGLVEGDVVTAKSVYNSEFDMEYVVPKTRKVYPTLRRDSPKLSENFKTCQKSADLVTLLRENKFTVIMDYDIDEDNDGAIQESAVAYGLTAGKECVIALITPVGIDYHYENINDNIAFEFVDMLDKIKYAPNVSKALPNEEILAAILEYEHKDDKG